MRDGRLRAVKGGHKGLDDRRTKRPRMDHGQLTLGIKKTQGQEDNEDGIGQVEEYDEIVVLGGGQTCVYIRNDEDGVCQAKKKIQKRQTLVNYAWTVWWI